MAFLPTCTRLDRCFELQQLFSPASWGVAENLRPAMAEIVFARRKDIRVHLDHMSGFRPMNAGRSLFGLGYKCPKYTPLFVVEAMLSVLSPFVRHFFLPSLSALHTALPLLESYLHSLSLLGCVGACMSACSLLLMCCLRNVRSVTVTTGTCLPHCTACCHAEALRLQRSQGHSHVVPPWRRVRMNTAGMMGTVSIPVRGLFFRGSMWVHSCCACWRGRQDV